VQGDGEGETDSAGRAGDEYGVSGDVHGSTMAPCGVGRQGPVIGGPTVSG
jgi:hypothetical protein